MFRLMYKSPRFVGAHILPPNTIMIIMKDGVEFYTVKNLKINSEATIDKQAKELKALEQEKDKILDLFVEPTLKRCGRFTVVEHDL